MATIAREVCEGECEASVIVESGRGVGREGHLTLIPTHPRPDQPPSAGPPARPPRGLCYQAVIIRFMNRKSLVSSLFFLGPISRRLCLSRGYGRVRKVVPHASVRVFRRRASIGECLGGL